MRHVILCHFIETGGQFNSRIYCDLKYQQIFQRNLCFFVASLVTP